MEEDHEGAPLLPEGGQAKDNLKHLSITSLIVRYTAALLFIVIAGASAWWIAGDGGRQDTPNPHVPPEDWWKSQILGWLSAILFVRLFFCHRRGSIGSANGYQSRDSLVPGFLKLVSLAALRPKKKDQRSCLK